ncbi:MAG: c-type cytochrome [Betaproteobacteria bacterium]
MRLAARTAMPIVFLAMIFPALADTPGGTAATSPAAPATVFASPNLTAAGVRSMAATCAPCHGTNGSSAGGPIPGLAGGNKEYLVSQMQAFRDGKRQATVMQQLARGYSDAEYAALGDYFAAQKK